MTDPVDVIFELDKFLGTWYELIHYPSWFERGEGYNTMTHYDEYSPTSLQVCNATIINGKNIEVCGIATRIDDKSFQLEFPNPEISRFTEANEFRAFRQITGTSVANYIIDHLWMKMGEYTFAIVTDANKQTLHVLSREKHPALADYNVVMNYVIKNYDRSRLVQTPHFD